MTLLYYLLQLVTQLIDVFLKESDRSSNFGTRLLFAHEF